nr:hypothetical protein [Tanacetum cinerariifolium]
LTRSLTRLAPETLPEDGAPLPEVRSEVPAAPADRPLLEQLGFLQKALSTFGCGPYPLNQFSSPSFLRHSFRVCPHSGVQLHDRAGAVGAGGGLVCRYCGLALDVSVRVGPTHRQVPILYYRASQAMGGADAANSCAGLAVAAA